LERTPKEKGIRFKESPLGGGRAGVFGERTKERPGQFF